MYLLDYGLKIRQHMVTQSEQVLENGLIKNLNGNEL